MVNKPKKGRAIWFKAPYVDVNQGVVEKTGTTEKGVEYIKIQGVGDTHGTYHALPENCYTTKEELLTALQEKEEAKIRAYCADIHTVKDLVQFMYENTVAPAEEYTNWEARRAAAISAKNLLGIDLENPLTLKDADLKFAEEMKGETQL